MKPKQEVVVLVHLSIFLLAIRSAMGQEKDPNAIPESNPDDIRDQQYGGGSYNSYDYTYEQYSYDPPEEYQCYSCTFHVRQGTAAGLDNCRDPFVKVGIPQVPCKGHCAKIYHKTSDTEYTVTRICLPGCKAVRDEKGYTQCCVGHLCNSSSSFMGSSGILVMFLSITVAALALR